MELGGKPWTHFTYSTLFVRSLPMFDSRWAIRRGEAGAAIFLGSALALLLGVLRDRACPSCAHGSFPNVADALIILVAVWSYPWLLTLWARFRTVMLACGLVAYAIAVAHLLLRIREHVGR